jgi:hypothetical protein
MYLFFCYPGSITETWSIKSCRHEIVDPHYYQDFEAPQGYYTDTPNKIAILSLDLAVAKNPCTREDAGWPNIVKATILPLIDVLDRLIPLSN